MMFHMIKYHVLFRCGKQQGNANKTHFSSVPLQIKLTLLHNILSKKVPTARLKNGQPLIFSFPLKHYLNIYIYSCTSYT